MIDDLFLKFAAMYGSQFINKWAGIDIDMVKAEWTDALSNYNNRTILMALNHCRHECKNPPSLPEFLQLCRDFRIPDPKPEIEHKKSYSVEPKSKLAELKELINSGRFATKND